MFFYSGLVLIKAEVTDMQIRHYLMLNIFNNQLVTFMVNSKYEYYIDFLYLRKPVTNLF